MAPMIFDPGVSVDSAEDFKEFVLLTGKAPTKLQAYHLAKKLLHSRGLADFKFVDVVPMWEKGSFQFRLIKATETPTDRVWVKLESPNARDLVKNKIILSGSCSLEGSEVLLTGDLSGKTSCLSGKWKVEISISGIKLPLLGVKVSHGLNHNMGVDYRSFLIPFP
jgi:hypothetical protein